MRRSCSAPNLLQKGFNDDLDVVTCFKRVTQGSIEIDFVGVLSTIFDDRDESAGKKFSDGDLIGVPFQLIIGPRELKNGNVELKIRKTNKKEIISFERAIDKIKSIIFEE